MEYRLGRSRQTAGSQVSGVDSAGGYEPACTGLAFGAWPCSDSTGAERSSGARRSSSASRARTSSRRGCSTSTRRSSVVIEANGVERSVSLRRRRSLPSICPSSVRTQASVRSQIDRSSASLVVLP